MPVGRDLHGFLGDAGRGGAGTDDVSDEFRLVGVGGGVVAGFGVGGTGEDAEAEFWAFGEAVDELQ